MDKSKNIVNQKKDATEEGIISFADIKLWKNGFDYGLKLKDKIISYSITEHLAYGKQKRKFAKAFIEQLKIVEKLEI